MPEYIPNIRKLLDEPTRKGCNFYEHATCVSYVLYYFDPIVTHCKPSCLNSEYAIARIQYTGEPQIELDDEMKMANSENLGKLRNFDHIE